MNWLETLFLQPGVANSVLLLSLVIAIGLILSRIHIKNISFGVTWILFVGIFVGQLGLQLDAEIGHFAKEFGLILFIYSIGIEVGPGFFQSFKKGGVLLNTLAMTIVLLGCAMMLVIQMLTGDDKAAMVGVLYGAVTNTPGLGAAQQTFSDLNNGLSNSLYAQGYAVAYPLAVVGIILSITFLKCFFRVDKAAEDSLFEANSDRNGANLQRTNQQKAASQQAETSKPEDNKPHLFYIFLGIALGVVLGMLPIAIPGIPVPIKLGLAGGPLIVSILISHYGPKLHIPTHTTKSANLMIREIGICLFMAAVGIGAGQGFIQTIMNGGYMWVIYGFAITVVPCLAVGLIARYCFNLSYYTIAGLISGAMTDPPALAYSNSLCSDQQSSVAYSTVYPLTMFLRVLMAQMLVITL